MSKKITKKIVKIAPIAGSSKVKITKKMMLTPVFEFALNGREVEFSDRDERFILDAFKRFLKAQELLKASYERE